MRAALPLTAAVVTLVALLIPLLRQPAQAQATPDPIAIVEKSLHQGFARRSFSIPIQCLRSDPRFLEACLAPYEQEGLQFAYLEGRITWVAPETFDIYLNPRGRSGMVSHFTSDDGFNLALVPTEGFIPGPAAPAPSPSPSPSAASPSAAPSGSPQPSEAPSGTPSASPSAAAAAPSPTASPSPVAASTPDPMRACYRYHPLTMLWPFQLKKTPTNVTFTVAGEETLNHRKCWKINRIAPDLTMLLWISQDDYAVDQIEYDDPQTGKLVRFNASEFFVVSPEEGQTNQVPLLAFAKATLGAGMSPLLDVSGLQAPTIIPPSPSPSPSVDAAPTRAPAVTRPEDLTGEQPRVMSRIVALLVLALLGGLSYYAVRYVMFRMRRTAFSKELIVLDDADGTLGRALNGLGFTCAPASMEILTEERNRVGKKIATEVLPRAVVIAPHSIALAKNYLFLLRAYAEEGGRVMLLHHGKADAPLLPYKAYTLPNSGEKMALKAQPHVWKRLRAEDVETKTGHLLPREYVVEVNQKRPDLDLVHVINRASGMRASIAGVVRAGKGEFIFCQFLLLEDLKKSKLETSPITKLLLLDLLDYLQGRTNDKDAPADDNDR